MSFLSKVFKKNSKEKNNTKSEPSENTLQNASIVQTSTHDEMKNLIIKVLAAEIGEIIHIRSLTELEEEALWGISPNDAMQSLGRKVEPLFNNFSVDAVTCIKATKAINDEDFLSTITDKGYFANICIYGFRRNSQMHMMIDNLKRKSQGLEFFYGHIVDDDNKLRHVYYAEKSDVPNIEYQSLEEEPEILVTDSRYAECSIEHFKQMDEFRDHRNKNSIEDHRMMLQLHYTSKLFSQPIEAAGYLEEAYKKTLDLNKKILAFINGDKERDLFIQSMLGGDDLSLPLTTSNELDFVRDFDWSLLEEANGGYADYVIEKRMANSVVFPIIYIALINSCIYAHKTIKCLTDYPEAGYISSLIDDFGDGFARNHEGTNISAAPDYFIESLGSSELFREFGDKRHDMTTHEDHQGSRFECLTDDAQVYNSKLDCLQHLSVIYSGETLSAKIFDKHKKQAELFRNDNPLASSGALYDFILIQIISRVFQDDDGYKSFIKYERSFSSLSKKEKTAVQLWMLGEKVSQVLNIKSKINELIPSFLSIVFNQGASTLVEHEEVHLGGNKYAAKFKHDFYSAIEKTLIRKLPRPDEACNSIITFMVEIAEESKLQSLTNKVKFITGNGQGRVNLFPKNNQGEKNYLRNPLILGKMTDGGDFCYGGEGSLVTIAPPRSGKSRTQVIPNLKATTSSVFVIDPKGECFKECYDERLELSGGKVFRFSPFDDESDIFNPLEQIGQGSIWKDSKFIAELVIPVVLDGSSNSSFFRDMAVDYLATIFTYLKCNLGKYPQHPTLGDATELLFLNKLETLQEGVGDVRQAIRYVNRLKEQPQETLQGIISTAQRELSVWDEDAIFNVTAGQSDWCPETLMAKGCSIFMCFPPSVIETYSSVIRVISALHIKKLLETLPDKGMEPDVVLFLDELPLLGYMKPVEDAVYVGAQYGLRAWIFAQGLGQIENNYKNAHGLISACDIRTFMNPTIFDNLAKKISADIGMEKDPITGASKPILTEQEISGDAFSSKVFVFGNKQSPVIVDKNSIN